MKFVSAEVGLSRVRYRNVQNITLITAHRCQILMPTLDRHSGAASQTNSYRRGRAQVPNTWQIKFAHCSPNFRVEKCESHCFSKAVDVAS